MLSHRLGEKVEHSSLYRSILVDKQHTHPSQTCELLSWWIQDVGSDYLLSLCCDCLTILQHAKFVAFGRLHHSEGHCQMLYGEQMSWSV